MFTTTSTSRLAHRAAIGVVALTALAACGGSDASDTIADPDVVIDQPTDVGDTADLDAADLDAGDLDTDGLDDGQLEILDDVLDDGFEADGPSPVLGVRLVGPRSVQTITDAFPDEVTLPMVDVLRFPENHQQGDGSVLVAETIWVASATTLHLFDLTGVEITTVTVGDVLPGDDQAEFVAVDGDESGLFALVTGFDQGVIAEIDPVTGALVATHDVNTLGLRVTQLAVGPTHVAAVTNGSAPTKLLDRSTGIVTEIGDADAIKGVAITSERLVISKASRNVNDPYTYDAHSLTDGSLVESGDLPNDTTLRTHGDRVIQFGEFGSETTGITEIAPLGTPAETLLPDEIEGFSDWVERDGVIFLTGACCVVDGFGNGLGTVAIDAATGTVLGGDQASGPFLLLP